MLPPAPPVHSHGSVLLRAFAYVTSTSVYTVGVCMRMCRHVRPAVRVCMSVCVRWGCSLFCLCLQRVSRGLHKNRAKIAAARGEEERALLARTQSERDRGAQQLECSHAHSRARGHSALPNRYTLCLEWCCMTTENL